jgi:signal transduction histidine kinase
MRSLAEKVVMKTKPPTRILRSVFAKLLGVILVTGVCLNLLMGAFFHYMFRYRALPSVQRNAIQYVDYLIRDLGTPPRLERARDIADRAALKIRYDSPGGSWATADDLAAIPASRFREWTERSGIRIGRYRGHHVVEVRRGEERFSFELARESDREAEHARALLLLLAVSISLLAGAYFWIRRILRPIKWLSEGVERVGQGDLDHRVPVKSTDELRDLAEAFNQMTARLDHMLKANERLLVDVSHELRSPLARMRVALEFVADGKTRQSLVGDIDEVEAMVTEILETARLRHTGDRMVFAALDMTGLLAEVLPAFDHIAPGVRFAEAPQDAIVYGDASLIRIVLNNVISNGIKFSKESGRPVAVTVCQTPPHVIVRVRDNGGGIAPEDVAFIFEPFYRADKSRSRRTGGYGLGLSLCKTIMEAHKGRIEIHSHGQPGEGTTVSLFFPDRLSEKG